MISGAFSQGACPRHGATPPILIELVSVPGRRATKPQNRPRGLDSAQRVRPHGLRATKYADPQRSASDVRDGRAASRSGAGTWILRCRRFPFRLLAWVSITRACQRRVARGDLSRSTVRCRFVLLGEHLEGRCAVGPDVNVALSVRPSLPISFACARDDVPDFAVRVRLDR